MGKDIREARKKFDWILYKSIINIKSSGFNVPKAGIFAIIESIVET